MTEPPVDEEYLARQFQDVAAPGGVARWRARANPGRGKLDRTRPNRSRAVISGVVVMAVVAGAIVAGFGLRARRADAPAASPTAPPARAAAAMAYDSAHTDIVLFGGHGDKGDLNDTWTWDGAGWTLQHPTVSPPVRSGASMAFDPVSSAVILFGGQGDPRPADRTTTGVAGVCAIGATGQPVPAPLHLVPPPPPTLPTSGAPASSPSTTVVPAPAARIAPSSHLGIPPEVCNGPYMVPPQLSDTWSWDGHNWTEEHPQHAPPASLVSYLATDEASQRVVLFTASGPTAVAGSMSGNVSGAACSPGVPCAPVAPIPAPVVQPVPWTTWMWDGSKWTERQQPAHGASTLFPSAMAYDASSRSLILFSDAPAVSCAMVPAQSSPPAVHPGEPAVSIAPKAPAISPPGTAGLPSPAPCAESAVTGSTWRWAEGHWSAETKMTGPAPPGSTVVAPGARDSIVGLDTSGVTWTWSGAWTERHPLATPGQRFGQASAYDAAHRETVLFGGFTGRNPGGGTPHLINDTWTWDGDTWARHGGQTSPSSSLATASATGGPGATCDLLKGGNGVALRILGPRCPGATATP